MKIGEISKKYVSIVLLVAVGFIAILLITFIQSKKNDIYIGKLQTSNQEQNDLLDLYDISIYYIDNYKGQIICSNINSAENNRKISSYELYGITNFENEVLIMNVNDKNSTCTHAFNSSTNYNYKKLKLKVLYNNSEFEVFDVLWEKI